MQSTLNNRSTNANHPLSIFFTIICFNLTRAATIELLPTSTMTTEKLTAYAQLAGFDYVYFSSPSSIEVCVKLQDGLEAQMVSFPQTKYIAAPAPVGEEEEYDYPAEHFHESRRPLLFDTTGNPYELSDYFKQHVFVSPGIRYVRLDPVFIDLLDIAYTHFPAGFDIIPGSAYRPRSVNRNNIETRHENEKYRFQMGQAVEVKPSNTVNDDTLFQLGISFMKAERSFRVFRTGLGIGVKLDRLYIHIKPLKKGETPIDIWDSGNPSLYRRFKDIQDQISQGNIWQSV